MKPGLELDVLIAKNVMGLPVAEGEAAHYIRVSVWDEELVLRPVPLYSTDIAAAWQVINTLDELISLNQIKGGGWECVVYTLEGYKIKAIGETAAHAICLAALEAKGVSL